MVWYTKGLDLEVRLPRMKYIEYLPRLGVFWLVPANYCNLIENFLIILFFVLGVPD